MDGKAIGALLVLASVLTLTAAQIIIKTRLSVHGAVPFRFREGLAYLLTLAADWRVWLGFGGLIIASVLWYAAVSRIPLSLAYPIGALAYPVIFASSIVLLHEPFNWYVLLGNLLVVAGVVLASGLIG